MSERHTKRKRKHSAFTLIELLIVIAIIVALASVLLPAMNAALKKADATKARAEVKSLVNAWKAYFNEYGRWPVENDNRLFNLELEGKYRPLAGEEGEKNESTGIVMVVTVMTNIMYPSASLYAGKKNMNPICTKYNPKREVFLTYRADSVDKKRGDMVDPWDKPYKVMFDVNRDGKVDRPKIGSLPATSVYDSVISWSTGPDGRESADDVNSWQ